MSADPVPDSSSTPNLPAPPPEGRLDRIFLGNDGLRTGWRLLLYGAFWLMIRFAATILVFRILRLDIDPYSPLGVSVGELIDFASAYAAALLMARMERCDPGVYGLPLSRALGKSFWQGAALGLGEVSLLVGLIAALGGYSFGSLTLQGVAVARWGISWAIAFLFVGLSEEFLFRGYAQYALARGIGFWPAAVTLSLVFGAAHWRNPGEGLTGVANVVVTGLVFAFALRRTGNLWLAVGWHASFDFGETFLFSVPNSGFVFDHHLSNSVLHGASWLTGGTVGPEGSVFSFLTMGLSALLIHYLFPAKKETASQA